MDPSSGRALDPNEDQDRTTEHLMSSATLQLLLLDLEQSESLLRRRSGTVQRSGAGMGPEQLEISARSDRGDGRVSEPDAPRHKWVTLYPLVVRADEAKESS